jgi:hypothetical protein
LTDTKGYNFDRGAFQNYCSNIWFNLAKWFQKKRLDYEKKKTDGGVEDA